jgi:hypothetical protein
MKRNLIASIGVRTVAVALVLAAGLRLAGQEQPQQTEQPSGNTATISDYNFLIASGFLCEPNDPTICPAVARSANGETVEISGAGTLNAANKSVAGAGAFTQKALTGNIVATGIWTATALVSFQSYGTALGALLHDYPQFRALGAFPTGGPIMRGPMASLMAGPLAAGGLAVLRIRLLPDVGTARDGLLRINCAKGKLPDEEQSDGVRLTITEGPAFDEQAGGRTVFLLQRPGPSFAWKPAVGHRE